MSKCWFDPFNKLVYIGLETTGLDTSRQPPAQPSIVAHRHAEAAASCSTSSCECFMLSQYENNGRKT